MTKYIHIGFPKNFSTSLQRDYFSKHPEIYHLGIGLDSNLGYRDAMVEKTLEVYLKTCKEYKYLEEKGKITAHFQNIFNSEKNTQRAIGISAEHLSFSFSYDSLSAPEKARRLFEIFGKETKIIMIVRNQFDLIKSLYRESVRVGFAGDFNSYFKLIYKYQDRNFIYDFRYDLMFETYTKLFGSENVAVFFFEEYREQDGEMILGNAGIKLFEDLNIFLKLSNPEMVLEHYNEALPSKKILNKALLNKAEPHDLGNHLLESAEKHRIKKYLEEDLHYIENENKTYSDVLVKRKLTEKAITSEDSNLISYNMDAHIVDKLKSFYETGNRNLEAVIQHKMPKSYFNLVL
ncbi:hypothetical protein [Rasiella sp. SM2506]|uniref:hypothetical protein n=1 Tax=Rasiella sp. SM2506 TaxID=3423914 RepID=UPI003D79913D